MSPFAPRSSFVPTSLHLIMPIKSTEGCVGLGRERWREGTSCRFSFSLTRFHCACVQYKERFDLNENVIALSCRFFFFILFFFFRFYLCLVKKHSLLLFFQAAKMLDLPAASSEPRIPSCSWTFIVHFAFPSKLHRVNYLQSGRQQMTLK